MVSLYINGRLADLQANTPIPYTYRFDDVEIPGAIRTGSSRTLTLPGTLNNSNIFGGIEHVQSSGFNASVKAEYELFNNGERINKGYLQLTNISKDNLAYEVVLFDELGNFFNGLKDKKLTELNVNITHNINANYLKNSWLNTGYSDVEYMPALQGFYPGFDSNKYVNSSGVLEQFDNNYNEWEMGRFSSIKQTPALRVLTLLNAFKNEYNINFNNLLSDPILESLYVSGIHLQDRSDGVALNNYSTLFTDGSVAFTGYDIKDKTIPFKADGDALGLLVNSLPSLDNFYGKEIDVNAGVNLTFKDFVIRSQELIDSGLTSYELHPISKPSYGNSVIKYSLQIDDQELSVSCDTFRLVMDNGKMTVGFYGSDESLEASFNKKLYPKVNNVGSKLNFLNVWDYRVWNRQTQRYEDFTVNVLDVFFNIYVDVIYKAKAKIDVVVTGTQVTYERLLPKNLTQFDFLVNLAKHLGWVFYFDDFSNQVMVCNRKDYYLNIIEDLPVLERLSIKPLVFDKNQLIFGYKENTGNSFFSEYKDKTDNNYGDKLVNTGYEFNSEKQRYFGSTAFESPILIDYGFHRLINTGNSVYETEKTVLRLPLLASLKDKDYEYSACNLQLYFKSGSFNYNYHIFDELISDENSTYRDGLSMTSMPLFTSIKDGVSLDYGKPEVSFTGITDEEYPESYTLFDQRFKSFIIDRYNVDSRLYTCKVYIPLSKLLDDAGRKFYYLDNSYWIIESIVDYDYSNPGVAQVTLLKVKDINNYKL